ncbi:MAG: glycosyltransferase [Armatimonadetes bacterium]|nr:glycosyltransferase [Armatimonadota bacterium]
MRILFVTPYVPSRIRVRSLNFIKQLCRKHEVTLVALTHGEPTEEESISELYRYCKDVVFHRLTKTRAMSTCCMRLFSGMPLQTAYTRCASARRTVRRMVQSNGFDLLHVEHVRGAYLAAGIQTVPVVYDSVDCITLLIRERLAQTIGILERILNLEEIIKMRVYEPLMAAMFDKVVITSRRDKLALALLMYRLQKTRVNGESGHAFVRGPKRFTHAPGRTRDRLFSNKPEISVIPNGVDTEYFRPMDVPINRGSIVFTGKMSYFANSAAAVYFCNQVFPLVRSRMPDASFWIVGSNPPASVRRLAGGPVKVTGYVDDVRPFIAGAEVVVCPLDVGVGIQNKLLEAMAMKKAVVASSVACHGIPDAVDDVHLSCGNSPEEMARKIIELMRDASKRSTMGEVARHFVSNRYSWETAAQKLVDVYWEAIETRTGRASIAA